MISKLEVYYTRKLIEVDSRRSEAEASTSYDDSIKIQ